MQRKGERQTMTGKEYCRYIRTYSELEGLQRAHTVVYCAQTVPGGVLALLSKKLLVNSVGALFDLLAKTGSRDAIRTASNYLSTALYVVYRHLYQANPDNNPDFFSVSPQHFHAGLADADMKCSLAELEDALAARVKEKGPMPSMSNNDLVKSCPTLYPSLLQVVHSAGERVAALLPPRQSGKK